jgi:small subunit ribosomal protein S2
MSKKDRAKTEEEIDRLNRYLGGIKTMTSLPAAIYIVDTTKEDISVAESLRMGTPIVALVDTNCNPDVIDYPIPSNDDAIRAIKLITSRVADAVLEGMTAREYAREADFEAEDVEVSAYTETGYVASPDEPDPTKAPLEEEAAEAEASIEEAPAAEATPEPAAAEAEPDTGAAAEVSPEETVAEAESAAEATEDAPEPAAEKADSTAS